MYTYNNPLTYVLTTAKLNATGYRWVAALADFNFSVKYRPGHANIDADFHSRMPTNIENFIKECTEGTPKDDIQWTINAINANKKHDIGWVAFVSGDAEVIQLMNTPSMGGQTPIPLGNIQEDDPVIAPVLKVKLGGGRPPTWDSCKESIMTRLLMREWSKN